MMKNPGMAEKGRAKREAAGFDESTTTTTNTDY